MACAGKLQRTVAIMVVLSTISCYFVSSADPDHFRIFVSVIPLLFSFWLSFPYPFIICFLLFSISVGVTTNGFPCKPTFNASDFFYAGLAKPATVNNAFGATPTRATAMEFPGLNTQGLALSRVDFAPGGLNQLHTHPRATEIIYVLYGELIAMFATTADVFVSKTIKQGDVFVFPRGLVHGQINKGKGPASIMAFFNSQNPGVQTIAQTLFNSTPPVPDHVLSIAFQIAIEEVDKIKSKFAPKK